MAVECNVARCKYNDMGFCKCDNLIIQYKECISEDVEIEDEEGEQMTREEVTPTEKQIKYASYLAKRMDVKLPNEFTKQAYSEFISKWKPVVQHEDEGMNEPDAWQWQYS